MVQIINQSVCRGVAGKRVGKVKGVVIHNDAGSVYATAKHYLTALERMNNNQLANGFAHYYIDRNTIVRTEDTYNRAWHTANSDGNANYIGYEVCQSIGASEKDFLANEQAVFKQVADDLKYYGLPANRNTVRLHREFVATACPHRSWELHGESVNGVKDYFIAEIKKYMNNKGESLLEGLKSISNKKQDIITGTFNKNSSGLVKLEKYLKDHKWSYKRIVKGNNVTLKIGWFRVDNPGKFALEKFLAMNDWVYEVRFH